MSSQPAPTSTQPINSKDDGKKVTVIASDEDYQTVIKRPGVLVLDVFSSWAGPCEAIVSLTRKWKTEHGDVLNFIRVQCDQIGALTKYRNKSCPVFLIMAVIKKNGNVLKELKGVNVPLLEKWIYEEVQIEKQGGHHTAIQESTEKEPGLVGEGTREISNRQGSSYKRVLLHDTAEKTLAIIKPDVVKNGKVEEIKRLIYKNGFMILHQKEKTLTEEMAKELYAGYETKTFYQELIKFITSGPLLALVLAKENAVNEWRDLIGPTTPNPNEEKKTLRGIFGTDSVQNALHGSRTDEDAIREIEFLFPGKKTPIQRTLALIKPDIVQKGLVDEIMGVIKEHGFNVVIKDTIQFTSDSAGGFYLTHREKSYFENMVNWLAGSPSVALILEKENAVQEWRDLIGPTNPKEAQEKAPNSLRAKYGTNEIQNGFHGSKTEEYSAIETEYIFPDLVTLEAREITTRTFAMIKPNAFDQRDKIIEMIEKAGFAIIDKRLMEMTKAQVMEFYQEHAEKPFYTELVSFMSSNPVIGMVLEKEDCVREWRTLIGPTNPEKAKEEAPESIRALFGADGTRNAVHGSDSNTSAKREISFFFSLDSTEQTLAMIKPDASSRAEEIEKEIIKNGFVIKSKRVLQMSDEQAKEFYQEHAEKPFYTELVSFMSSGSVVAMILEKEKAIQSWRTLIGPTNPEKAKEEAPESIRALFGADGTRNAVHGSDSNTSAKREISFFFSPTEKTAVPPLAPVEAQITPSLETNTTE